MSATDRESNPSMMCRAHDCPNPWTVSREGHWPLCSHHAWVDKNEWPDITQRLINRIAFAVEKRPEPVAHMTVADRAATIKRMRAMMTANMGDNKDHKAWAKRLHARHLAGEKIGHAQIAMYRQALGIAEGPDDLQQELAA